MKRNVEKCVILINGLIMKVMAKIRYHKGETNVHGR